MTVVNFSSEIYHIAIVCLKKEQNAEVGCRIKLWRTSVRRKDADNNLKAWLKIVF